MHTYVGNIHIHTTYSDGWGTVGEISAAANLAGLDYLIITDHENRKAAKEERFYDKVAVIAGMELNRSCNHYLALGDLDIEGDFAGDPQKGIDEVNRQGGFGFLAHPFEKGSPLVTEGAAYPWNDWTVTDYAGLELWNYTSQWKGEALSKAKAVFWYIFNRDAPLKKGPMPECLKKWDELTMKKKVVAIGGTDAHAIPFRLGFIRAEIFPYQELFRSINTHVILPDKLNKNFAKAKKQILAALKSGSCYISFDRFHSGRGFLLQAVTPSQKCGMGEEVRWAKGTCLEVSVPSRQALIKLIKNGVPECWEKGRKAVFKIDGPGTYRVEVKYRSSLGIVRPWLYSNPVYVL